MFQLDLLRQAERMYRLDPAENGMNVMMVDSDIRHFIKFDALSQLQQCGDPV